MPINITPIWNNILTQLYHIVHFLQTTTFQVKEWQFNLLDFSVAMYCLANVICILFGEFIGDDDLDDDE